MKKRTIWLSGLLVLQLLVSTGLLIRGHIAQSQLPGQPLLNLDISALDRIRISDQQTSALLQKHLGQWRLPDLAELPANAVKLTSVLDKLAGLQTGWPVATSDSSHSRFEVAPDQYQRRVELYQGDQLVGDLYLGAASGLRQTHLRKAGAEQVYSAQISQYELPTKKSEWLDKSLLSAQNIEQIRGNDYLLQKQQGQWRISDQTDEEADLPLDREKAQQLAGALSALQVLSVADKPVSEEAVSLEVKAGEKTWRYRFSQAEDRYYVSRDDIKSVFELGKADFEKITAIQRDNLIVKTQTQEQPDSSS